MAKGEPEASGKEFASRVNSDFKVFKLKEEELLYGAVPQNMWNQLAMKQNLQDPRV